jgi:hypothetical protein
MMNHAHGWMSGWMGGRIGGGVWLWPVSTALIAALVILVIVKVSRKKS